MIAWLGASLALVAAISIGCGKYGPPERVQPEAESPDAAAPAAGSDSSEEDSDQQEQRP